MEKSYKSSKINVGLGDEYLKLFKEIQNNKMNIFEIGIQHGGSLQWFRDMFPNATVYGIDIKKKWKIENMDRIHPFLCNQEDTIGLKKIVETIGVLDIIIDDGCHRAVSTRLSFDALWGYLSPGGYYIIEDWHAAYWKTFKDYYKGMEDLVCNIAKQKIKHNIGEINIYCNEQHSFALYRKNLCVI